MLAVGDQKVCSSCRQDKPLHAFNKNGTLKKDQSGKLFKDGLQNACKDCKSVMTREWKRGLKSGDRERMRVAQAGLCKICGAPAKELVIDHCHRTGRVRALLCRSCNALLGMCNDNIAVLTRAIEYLASFREE